MNSLKRADFSLFVVLEEFDEDLDEPSNEKIYSSGDQGVKKDLGGELGMGKSLCHSYSELV